MKILFATAEASPYFKTGGLGDVARSLPDALRRRGLDVRIIHPFYGSAAARTAGASAEAAAVHWTTGAVPVRYVLHEPEDAAPAVLVRQPAVFEGGEPYLAAPHDPLEPGRRFAFFCRAIVQYANAWGADVVHLNDWPTALVPAYGLLDGLRAATVLAIHNVAYQGNFDRALLPQIGLPWDLFRTENGVEFYGSASFLKTGVALADRLITVSPTHALEIRTPEYGAGLDGVLRFRHRVLHGILNGIDRNAWDPAHDTALAQPFTARHLAARDANREALLEAASLEPDGPLLVAVTRLAFQKGIDILLRAAPALIRNGARIAILGDGEPAYEIALREAAAAAPGRFAAFLRFDEGLARRMYAGGDFFLMPSRYEPCGLGQMIAQRYGAPPIVRRTGGLADTVEDGRTGFVFDDPTPDALAAAVARATATWRARGWDALRRRCMRLDWSWTRSARLYEQVHQLAIGALSG